jgi:hypothetical protein
MIKHFLKWYLVLVILNSNLYGNSNHQLIIDGKVIVVKSVNDAYFTNKCLDITKCFILPGQLKFSPKQNILFSLCYQSNGSPKFAQFKISKEKITVCIGSKGLIDLDTMMYKYKKIKNFK